MNSKIHIRSVVPSMATILALCLGITSVRYALKEEWGMSVLMIWIAVFLDSVDGSLARSLRVVSRFGAELDSIADFSSFGVAPALVSYIWYNNNDGHYGWVAVLIFVSCIALRLARFNVQQLNPSQKRPYFTGIPSTVAGPLLLLPISIHYVLVEYQIHYLSMEYSRYLLLLYSLAVSLLTVSGIPVISGKYLRVQKNNLHRMTVVFVLIIYITIKNPWLTTIGVSIAYWILIPFFATYIYKQEKSVQSVQE